jgi:hypothetical protein
MNELVEYVPFLIPLFIVQIILIVVALFDLLNRQSTRGPKWVWVLVILFVNIIGPIIYLVIGREE